MELRISVQQADFDEAVERARFSALKADIGAIASFTGLCRSERGLLAALELEHYPGMAEAELERIARLAESRWPVFALTIIHRHGLIRPGENIVLVLAASSHRAAAFSAAEFVMDFLKSSAPFWKREHRADGSLSGWVEAKDHDDVAAARWT
jgi:molybdopterin synthase catalytic subunit